MRKTSSQRRPKALPLLPAKGHAPGLRYSWHRVAILFLFFFLLPFSLAQGQTQTQQQPAADLGRALAEVRAALVTVAENSQRLETELAELETRLASLEAQEQSRTQRLQNDRGRIGELLGALERMARLPPEALLLHPEHAPDTARGAMLLSAAIPALQMRASALATDIQTLTDTRARLVVQREQVTVARALLAQNQQELTALLGKRELLARRTDSERTQIVQRMARLGQQSADLRQLMDRVEGERRAEENARARVEAERQVAERRGGGTPPTAPTAPAPTAPGIPAVPGTKPGTGVTAASVVPPPPTSPTVAPGPLSPAIAPVATTSAGKLPVEPAARAGGFRPPTSGRISVRFGEIDRFGATSRGITFVTRSGATVVSPLPGTIQFAGPFRGYGQILIVDHGNGYHSLLAGLGRIDGSVGQTVSAGEPIGVLAAPADGSPELYFEVRRNGQPVNPQRAFGGQDGKGQG